MCIIIRQVVHELLQRLFKRKEDRKGLKRRQSGFTLPEVLVSLCILLLLMQGVWQWGAVMQGTSNRIVQNQQAVLLAQQVFAGVTPQYPDGWQVEVEQTMIGQLLIGTKVTVNNNHRQWIFYYAGPKERLDE